MSILRINIVFFGPNMAASQLPSMNTKRLISPEREDFRGSNFDRFILGLYMFSWPCKLTY